MIVEHQVQLVFDQNVIEMMKSKEIIFRFSLSFFFFIILSLYRKNKFEPHLDENANDQFHHENNHRYNTPNKLQVKNHDYINEKSPRTPKPR